MNRLKEIHELVNEIVLSLSKKLKSEEELFADKNLSEPEIIEYTKGQLYEAQYILEKIEDIIYKEQ
jgi:hypothetical protein